MAFSVGPLLSIDAVGSELSAALHEYINGGTLSRASENSSGKARWKMAEELVNNAGPTVFQQ